VSQLINFMRGDRPTAELLNIFRDEGRRILADYGPVMESTAELSSGFIRLEADVAVATFFMSFGSWEGELTCTVQPRGRAVPHHLALALEASELDHHGMDEFIWINSVTQLRSCLATAATAFRTCHAALLREPLEFWTRAAFRDRQEAERQADDRRSADQRRAVALAAAAFHRRDFKRVVALLDEHRAHLSPAQAAKLSYAETHQDRGIPSILSGPG